MSYTVLARKWRPQKFEDVVGQRHVSRSLMNALGMGRVAHAFLFSGTRGVGKTTTARILAKALNCAAGPTPSPCGECDSCKEIAQGNAVDVIEIDAASNTGVDNVRELRENAKYAPAKSKYKVYIIDEVHMLSGAAFNALLKTLEEPPAHVVFILATTDPHKLPATILSRCQHYDFRRVPKAEIEEHLSSLCGREGITADRAALARVAALAEGSVRDSLSLLDQVISYCGEGGIKESDIEESLGLVGREAVKEAARAVLSQDAAAALGAVDALVDKGQDLRRFAAELMGFFRDLLVSRVTDAPGRALEVSATELEELKGMSGQAAPDELIRVMNLLARLADEMRWTGSPRISLELALVKAASRPIGTVEEVLSGIKALKDSGAPAADARPRMVREPAPKPASKQAVEEEGYYRYPEPEPQKVESGSAADLWDGIRSEVKRMGKAPLAGKMTAAAPKSLDGGVLEIIEGPIPFTSGDLATIREAAKNIGCAFSIKTGKGNGGKEKTHAEIKAEQTRSHKEKIRQEAMQDPIVKSAIDLFGGEIVEVEDEKS